MSLDVQLVDYGLSNIFSVRRALETVGARVHNVGSANEIVDIAHMVLPGVGAFGAGVAEMNRRGLVEPVRRHIAAGRPFLGICVGMQLMVDAGEEHGIHQGLAVVPGRCVHLDQLGPHSERVPHVSWRPLWPPQNTNPQEHSLLKGVEAGEAVYFVHSYFCRLDSADDLVAEAEFGPYRFAAMIGRGKAVGCQFHPEKSGGAGLQILANFMAMSDA